VKTLSEMHLHEFRDPVGRTMEPASARQALVHEMLPTTIDPMPFNRGSEMWLNNESTLYTPSSTDVSDYDVESPSRSAFQTVDRNTSDAVRNPASKREHTLRTTPCN